jgi:hypothetical protein
MAVASLHSKHSRRDDAVFDIGVNERLGWGPGLVLGLQNVISGGLTVVILYALLGGGRAVKPVKS